MYDLVVKDALIADGTGRQMYAGDVAVKDGRIAEIGSVGAKARDYVDAGGNVLAPGIIDIHTHYDAQLLWDPAASPSTALGVTTIVIGNCGFSLAPTPPEMQPYVLGDLAVVEAISAKALETGVTWDFSTFAEYLSSLRRRGTVPNVGAFVGHSTVRTAVMQEDSSKRKATAGELQAMRGLIREAMDAGAIGLATTQSARAVGFQGRPIPSRVADDDEFRALVGVLADVGRGVYMHTGTPDNPTKAEFLEELATIAGRPVIWASAIHRGAVDPFMSIKMIQFCAEATRRGHTMYAQTACHPMEHNFTLHNAFPFEGYPAWAELRGANKAQMMEKLRDPEFRTRFKAQIAKPDLRYVFHGRWEDVTISEITQDRNREAESLSVAQLAAKKNVEPLDAFLDLALDEDFDTSFTAVMLNADEGGVAGQLAHDQSLICLSDAGAHVAFMCRAGFGLRLLSRWVRDNKLFCVEEAIRRVTSMPADVYGIRDRGRIVVGAHADMILFDPTTVGVSAPRRVNDYPAGETRVVCDPIGLNGVWVNGERIAENGKLIDEQRRPGQVGLAEVAVA